MPWSRRELLERAAAAIVLCGGGERLAFGGTRDARGTAARVFPSSVASGDPRSDSVVLWTRVDDDDASADRLLSLEVALDPVFTVMVASKTNITAAALHDHNVKVKVTGLRPSNVYYYRFTYEKSGKKLRSRVGRTKTAPGTAEDRKVKFVVATCQDFIGRYYNSWQRLVQVADEEIDFIIFLGDYIYETTGDPGFQSPAGALVLQPDQQPRW